MTPSPKHIEAARMLAGDGWTETDARLVSLSQIATAMAQAEADALERAAKARKALERLMLWFDAEPDQHECTCEPGDQCMLCEARGALRAQP